jgi:hypothetical protein
MDHRDLLEDKEEDIEVEEGKERDKEQEDIEVHI